MDSVNPGCHMAGDAAGKEARAPAVVVCLGHLVVRTPEVARNAAAAAAGVAAAAAVPGWNAAPGVAPGVALGGVQGVAMGAGRGAGFGPERRVAGLGAVLGVAGQDVAAADQGVGWDVDQGAVLGVGWGVAQDAGQDADLGAELDAGQGAGQDAAGWDVGQDADRGADQDAAGQDADQDAAGQGADQGADPGVARVVMDAAVQPASAAEQVPVDWQHAEASGGLGWAGVLSPCQAAWLMGARVAVACADHLAVDPCVAVDHAGSLQGAAVKMAGAALAIGGAAAVLA